MSLYQESMQKSNPKTNGYYCDKCKDKGYLVNVRTEGSEIFEEYAGVCECSADKHLRLKLKRSGLENVYKEYNFSNYITDTKWREDYKNRAESYVRNPNGWFVMLGQTGLGKTHLSSAIALALMKKGHEIKYISWFDEMVKAKNNYWNIDTELMKQLKTVKVLYIDDFLKMKNLNDIHNEEYRMAFNLIDARQSDKSLLTIISSEWNIQEIGDMNGALSGRIVRACGGPNSPNLIDSAYKPNGNFRLKGEY